MSERDPLPVSFGRYLLEERIGFGGMAEVFRARLDAEGFSRTVCIKRILPHVAADPGFIAMFKDEAALAAVLEHANIAKVFDFGEVDGALYLAMELIDGADLARLTRRLKETGGRCSVAQALHVGIELCRALQHAHTVKDAGGKPLHIVHRDVTPHNVLLSRAGEVKLTDFGIAKATDRLARTATGELKGKVNYMAPEQAEEGPVDHRADQFSTAILVWELLTGRPLFGDSASPKALLNVMACEVPPPSTLCDGLSAEHDRVLLRALAKDPAARFDDMRGFQQALLRLRFTSDEDPVAAELGPLVKRALHTGAPPAEAPKAPTPPMPAPQPAVELSSFDTASAIQRTATAPKYASLIERLEHEHAFAGEYADLVERFPSLRGAPGVRPWDPFALDAWAKGVPVERLESWDVERDPVADPVAFLAATFVIGSFFQRAPLLVARAQEVWDTEHKAAYASFFQHWQESAPFSHPWWRY